MVKLCRVAVSHYLGIVNNWLLLWNRLILLMINVEFVLRVSQTPATSSCLVLPRGQAVSIRLRLLELRVLLIGVPLLLALRS